MHELFEHRHGGVREKIATVFGGMLAALLVGTFFIPGFYAIVQSTREKVKRKLGVQNIVGKPNR